MELYRGRVAVVHKNQEICKVFESLFEGRGYYVLPCATPADALGNMLQTSFGSVDLLLMDPATACEKGVQLMQRLATHRPDFPVMLWILPEDQSVALRAVETLLGPSGAAEPRLMRGLSRDEDDSEETESEYWSIEANGKIRSG